jgi:hypothetical protein
VTEVAQEPPQPFRPARAAVGDDEDTGADARTAGGGRKVLGARQWMPPALARRSRKIAVDIEEARARDVALEIQLVATLGISELPPAVDELVAQAYQLPAGDGGNGTEDGWIT